MSLSNIRSHARRARRVIRETSWRLRIRPQRFAEFGVGSLIEAPSVIFGPDRITIGADVTIAARAFISMVEELNGARYDPYLVIGDRTKIGHDLFVSCAGSITIGTDVLISDRVFIGDSYHDYRDPSVPILAQPMSVPAPVKIEAGAFLGVGAIVLPGVKIGERAYIGAGAVVSHDIPALAVAAGNPAEVIRAWDADGNRWV